MPIITTPYLARVLGAEAIGIYNYTLSITTCFILLGSLGMAVYAQREIAYVQDDIEKRSKVFFEIILLRFITLGISIFTFYIMFASHGEYSVYYKILLIEIIAAFFDISWFFQGLEEFKKTVARNMLVKIISIILIFIFIKSPTDLWKYILIFVLSTFLGNVFLWTYLPKYIKKVKIKDLQLKQHLKPVILLFIPQIATQIYFVLDKAMIGYMVPDIAEVGYYGQAQKIIKMLLTIITSLGIVMLPRMSKSFAEGKQEEMQKYIKKSFNFVFFLGFPMVLGIISVTKNFVPLFYGPGYDKVEILMNTMSSIILFMGMSNVLGTQYLLPTKRQKQYTVSVVAGTTINAIANFILIRYFASMGAAIATILAEASVAIIQLYFVRKEIKVGELLSIAPNYILASAIMLGVNIVIQKVMPMGFLTISVQVIIGIICYLLTLYLLKDKFLFQILGQVKEKIKRVKG